MPEVPIPFGQFSINYHWFRGYQAPDEDVWRPVNDYEEIEAMYQRKTSGWQPVQVEIPNGLYGISYAAFECCRGLTAVSIPESIRVIRDNAFAGCTSLAQVTLSEHLAEIGKEAFRDCAALTRIRIPDTVTRIGISAFAGCTGLQEICLPEGLCRQIKRIFGEVEPLSWRWFSGKLQVNAALAATLEADLKRRRWNIGEKVIAEEDGETLDKYLVLWDKVPLDFLEELIEMSVNAKKTGITAMLMQYKNSQYAQWQQEAAYQRQEEKKLGVRSRSVAEWRRKFILSEQDGKYQINGCKEWGPVVEVPAMVGKKPVVAIAQWLPRNHTEPKEPYEVILPEGLQEIKASAFEGCSMRSITIPDTVAVIDRGAFCGCKNLESVRIPSGVTYLSASLFRQCEMLQSVVLPDSLTEMDPNAFSGCIRLTEVVFPANIQKVCSFFGYWRTMPLFLVPRGSVTEESFVRAKLQFKSV